MPSTKLITCACGCGRQREVRTADIKRGRGKFYSKSCKAKIQEARTGQYRKMLSRGSRREYGGGYSGSDIGQWE